MSLKDLYCNVDDFCRLFLPAWHRQLLTGGTRQRSSRFDHRRDHDDPDLLPKNLSWFHHKSYPQSYPELTLITK